MEANSRPDEAPPSRVARVPVDNKIKFDRSWMKQSRRLKSSDVLKGTQARRGRQRSIGTISIAIAVSNERRLQLKMIKQVWTATHHQSDSRNDCSNPSCTTNRESRRNKK